jgi:hypothetical protein
MNRACNCQHWTQAEHGGRCALGVGGGYISLGVCRRCKQYDGPVERVTGDPTPDLLTIEREVVRLEHIESCSSCSHNRGFASMPGTSLIIYSLCAACDCPLKRLNVLTKDCPKFYWRNSVESA